MNIFSLHVTRCGIWLVPILAGIIPAGCGRGGGGGHSSVGPAITTLDTDGTGALSTYAQIACSGSRVYVVWSDGRNSNMDIYFNSSSDGGVTWRTSDIRIDTDAPGAAGSVLPQIACSGTNVYVTWTDGRSGKSEIYFNSSNDGGNTWQASDLRLNTSAMGTSNAMYPQIACDGSRVCVTWADDRNGTRDIYFNSSSDGGDHWRLADIRLDTDAPGASYSDYPRIACSGASVYVGWEDARNTKTDVYFNSSSDGGSTWRANDIRIGSDAAGAAESNAPKLMCLGSSVYMVWSDLRNGQSDIYFNSSTNGGTTWRANDIRLDTDTAGAASSGDVQLAGSPSGLFVTWRDSRDGKWDICFNASVDGGTTWMASDVRLDTDAAGAHDSLSCRIACSGSDLCVVWQDDRNGVGDIYCNKSTDAGLTWLAQDRRLDVDPSGMGESVNPAIVPCGSSFLVVWEDSGAGGYDIYVGSAD